MSTRELLAFAITLGVIGVGTLFVIAVLLGVVVRQLRGLSDRIEQKGQS